LSEKPGAELVGTVYDSPLRHLIPRQNAIVHTVVTAGFVELDNTGMVHIAPGHGWDDYLLGVEKGLEVFCPVDGSGHYTDDGGAYAGQFVRDANEQILTDLGEHLLHDRRSLTGMDTAGGVKQLSYTERLNNGSYPCQR
jgi:isoleucyl-tRNA synthetase